MGCFRPRFKVAGRGNPSMTSRCGSLLPCVLLTCAQYDDVIVLEGPGGYYGHYLGHYLSGTAMMYAQTAHSTRHTAHGTRRTSNSSTLSAPPQTALARCRLERAHLPSRPRHGTAVLGLHLFRSHSHSRAPFVFIASWPSPGVVVLFCDSDPLMSSMLTWLQFESCECSVFLRYNATSDELVKAKAAAIVAALGKVQDAWAASENYPRNDTPPHTHTYIHTDTHTHTHTYAHTHA